MPCVYLFWLHNINISGVHLSGRHGLFEQADQDTFTAPVDLARLWVHECERVFRDRIINNVEMEGFDGMMADTAKKYLSEFQVRTINLGEKALLVTNAQNCPPVPSSVVMDIYWLWECVSVGGNLPVIRR